MYYVGITWFHRDEHELGSISVTICIYVCVYLYYEYTKHNVHSITKSLPTNIFTGEKKAPLPSDKLKDITCAAAAVTPYAPVFVCTVVYFANDEIFTDVINGTVFPVDDWFVRVDCATRTNSSSVFFDENRTGRISFTRKTPFDYLGGIRRVVIHGCRCAVSAP